MDMPRSREAIRDDLQSITDQISEGIRKGRYTAAELQRALVDRTRHAAESTDTLVHENPWAAIGVGVVIGLMIGLALPRQ